MARLPATRSASARASAAGTVLERMTTAVRAPGRHGARQARAGPASACAALTTMTSSEPGTLAARRRRGRGRPARGRQGLARLRPHVVAPHGKPAPQQRARHAHAHRPEADHADRSPFVASSAVPALRHARIGERPPCRQELAMRRHVVDPQQLHAPVQRPLRRRQRGRQAFARRPFPVRAPPSSPCARRPAGPGSRGRGAGPGGAARPDCAARAWRSTGRDRRSSARGRSRPPRRQRPAPPASRTPRARTARSAAPAFMVAGSPAMCISTTKAPDAAATSMAARVEGQAADVVDDRGPGRDRACHHRGLAGVDGDRRRPARPAPRTTGSTRRSSSSTGTGSAPGRVDSPPTSTMSAPSCGQPQPVLDGAAASACCAAVAEAVGRDVEDAHEPRPVEGRGARGGERRRPVEIAGIVPNAAAVTARLPVDRSRPASRRAGRRAGARLRRPAGRR